MAGNLKVNPEGFDYNRVAQKYTEQQERGMKEVLADKGASSVDEALKIEKEIISNQQSRRSKDPDTVELKDRTIKMQAKSQEITALEEKLRKDIESVVSGAMPHVSFSEEQADVPSLKDRVQPKSK